MKKISFISLKDKIVYIKNVVVDFIKRFYKIMYEQDVLFLASGIAFNGVLCLIPILLLFTSVLGIVLNSSELAVQKIEQIIRAAFPDQQYTLHIKNSIQQMIKDIIAYRKSFGLAGLAVLTWTATFLFSSLRTALNKVYRIKPTKLVILTILEDILWVIIIGLLFLTIIFTTWVYSLIETLLELISGFAAFDFSIFEAAFSIIASLILTFIMFYLVYRFIPDQRVKSKVAAISASTSTVLWFIAAKIFAWYISTFQSFDKLYGTYAFILVLLIWIYYSSLVFLIGGVVGGVVREKESEKNN